MRIALLADEDPGWGGIGTYTGILGAALQELGHEVHLVLRGWEDDGVETLGGLTVHRVVVPEPSWRRGSEAVVSRLFVARESLVFSARAAGVLRALAPDVVEAPEFHAPGLVPALRRCTVVVRLQAPAFITARLAGEPRDLDGRAGEALEALSAHVARVVSAPSAALADVVRRRWRLRKVDVVPNPVDEGLFAPAEDAAEVPASILVVGRVERGKGQDVLVEALPAIRDAAPDAHVRLVGDDGGAAEILARRAQELGVADAVAFEGARARQELPAVYRSAAVCVVPSRFEAFGYTAVEAMACGRAVVASRAGGLAEIVRDGEDGLLVAPEDPVALAGAVTRVLGDAALRGRLGAAARARVLSSFAARPVAERMARRYAEVAR